MLRLKQLRQERNWTMRTAAKFLNKPYSTYVNHEKGYREPTTEDLIHYAKGYDITVDYLVGRTDDPKGYGAEFVWEPVDDEVLRKTREGLEYDHVGVELLRKYHSLSFEGQMKVDAYINDLIASGLYTRSTGSKVG